MKYLNIIPLILLLNCKQSSQKTSIAIINNNSYDCILVEDQPDVLKCGVYKFIYALKFQPLDEKKNIAVLVECPDLYGAGFFKRNQKYKLRLTSDVKNIQGSVINDFKNLPTYYSYEITKIE